MRKTYSNSAITAVTVKTRISTVKTVERVQEYGKVELVTDNYNELRKYTVWGAFL